MLNDISDPTDIVYLDHHSTTPCDPRVSRVVQEVCERQFGNPSSPHRVGQAARRLVDRARSDIAEHVGALPGEVIFTSGATEANNLAILGLARGLSQVGERRGGRIVASSIEHKSVLKAAEASASSLGLEYSVLPASADGLIDLAAAEELIDEDTLLVSVQAVNNEIGTIQPVTKLAEMAHRNGALIHCDAAQALGRLRIQIDEWDVDALSLSAHKAYGPKGVGALIVSGGRGRFPLQPLLFGGGQEDGVRPGTLNTPAIAGFGAACRLLDECLESEITKMAVLRDRLENEIISETLCARPTVPREARAASTVSLRLEGVEAEAVVARLQSVALSTGSACEAGAPEPSHVLEAIGYSRREAYECIRAAVGRFTTEKDVDQAAIEIVEAVQGAAAATVGG